jgi:hypothetical protein
MYYYTKTPHDTRFSLFSGVVTTRYLNDGHNAIPRSRQW